MAILKCRQMCVFLAVTIGIFLAITCSNLVVLISPAWFCFPALVSLATV